MPDTIKAVAEAIKSKRMRSTIYMGGITLHKEDIELAQAAINAMQIREMTIEEVSDVVKEQIPSLYGIKNPYKDDFSNAKYATNIALNIAHELAKLGTIRIKG